MSWYAKEASTPFDTSPISGLYFLDGDWFATKLLIDWTKGEKCPMLVFPSGIECELWESRDPTNPTVHISGELDLALHDTCEGAYAHAKDIAEQVGYVVRRVDASHIEFISEEDYLLLTYDDLTRTLVNIEPVTGHAERPRPPLLDEESWKRLPPLRSQEHLLMNAIAHVKFFSPTSRWTWYATEAAAITHDGRYMPLHKISPNDPHLENVEFFGLVAGDEIEVGFFSLNELQSGHGGLDLPVERDRHFTPTTLKELREMHERERRM